MNRISKSHRQRFHCGNLCPKHEKNLNLRRIVFLFKIEAVFLNITLFPIVFLKFEFEIHFFTFYFLFFILRQILILFLFWCQNSINQSIDQVQTSFHWISTLYSYFWFFWKDFSIQFHFFDSEQNFSSSFSRSKGLEQLSALTLTEFLKPFRKTLTQDQSTGPIVAPLPPAATERRLASLHSPDSQSSSDSATEDLFSGHTSPEEMAPMAKLPPLPVPHRVLRIPPPLTPISSSGPPPPPPPGFLRVPPPPPPPPISLVGIPRHGAPPPPPPPFLSSSCSGSHLHVTSAVPSYMSLATAEKLKPLHWTKISPPTDKRKLFVPYCYIALPFLCKQSPYITYLPK